MLVNLHERQTSKKRKSNPSILVQPNHINQQQSEECFKMGKEHMLQKEHDKALEHYFSAIIHDSTNYKAYCNMGAIYRELGNFKEAKMCYQKALEIKNDDLITLYNYGNTLRVLGDCEVAIQNYQRVLHLDKSSQTLYLNSLINMGICYKIMGQYEEAIRVFDKAIQIKENEESAIFNKGMCFLKLILSTNKDAFEKLLLQRCDIAEAIFQKVLQLNSNNIAAKIALIEISYFRNPEQSKYEAAITAFKGIEQAISDQSTIQFINTKIGYCLACLKQYKKSSQHYNKGNIAKNSNSIKDSIKRQTIYDDFPNQNHDRPGSQRNEKRNSRQIGRPSTAKKEYSNEINKQIRKNQTFNELLEAEKFEQAFDIIKDMEEGIQKYQNQIILNYKEAETSREDFYLSSAYQIYKQNILNNDPKKQIKLDLCSVECHQVLAGILTYFEEHEQATKHYNVLSEYFRDQKLTPEIQKEMENLYENRGENFVVRGLTDRAVEEFQKGIKLDPSNYTLIRGLGRALRDGGRINQAKKIFQDHLKNLNPEKEQQKVIYIDCYLNIAECSRNEESEYESLNQAIMELEKYFPTLNDVLNNFDESSIQSMYLRLTDLFEENHYKKVSEGKEKQAREKLLTLYLSCLEFPNCPDREEIYINCGNLFFLNKEYSNALMFYRKLETKKELIANNIGLTFAYLSEPERALSCLQYALEQDPENPVYQINYSVLKWIHGIQVEESGQVIDILQRQFPHVSQTEAQHRVTVGLEIIQNLTSVLSTYGVQETRNIQIVQTIHKIIKNIRQSAKPKIKFALNVLNQSDKIQGEKPLTYELIEPLLYEIKSESYIEEYQKNALQKIKNLPKHSNFLSSTQLLFSLSAFCMTKPDSHKLFVELIKNQSIQDYPPVYLQTLQFKQNPEPYLKKVIHIQYPSIDLNLKSFLRILFEEQCVVESSVIQMCEFIEQKYYESQDINDQIKVDRMAPTNYQSFQNDINSLLKTFECMSKIANVSFKDRRISKQSDLKGLKDKYVKIFCSQFYSQLKEGKTRVYDDKSQNLTIQFNDSSLPITLKTSHKTWKAAAKFVDSLGFIPIQPLPNHQNEVGIQSIIINKSLILELQWGDISIFQSYLTLLHRKDLNPLLISLFDMSDIENQIMEIESLKEEDKQKILKIIRAKYVLKDG